LSQQKPSVLSGQLLSIDLLNMQFSSFYFKKHPACPQHGEIQRKQNNSSNKNITEITVNQLAKLLAENAPISLIDVRQTYEHEICDIGGQLLPLDQLSQQFNRIPKDKDIILYCKHGIRSQQAARFLIEQGYPEKQIYSLAGGIIHWIEQIQPELTKY